MSFAANHPAIALDVGPEWTRRVGEIFRAVIERS
jgi:hypothetical protein